jgi:hypothetical protein
MKKESRAVSSRDDGEGSCSQEKSPTRRSVVGVVVSSRRYRDPGAGAREGVLRAKIRRPPLPALAHPWPSLLELELLQDARTPLAGEVARAASGTPCSSCPAAARCAVSSWRIWQDSSLLIVSYEYRNIRWLSVWSPAFVESC